MCAGTVAVPARIKTSHARIGRVPFERPTDYVVEVGSATGMSNIAVLPVSLRLFSYEPVPMVSTS